MKKRLHNGLAGIAVCVFFSCNKSSDPDADPGVQDSLPKTASVYFPLVHARSMEYFTYDARSRLTNIHEYNYDKSAGTPDIDSFYVSFVRDASSDLPVAYDKRSFFPGEPPAGSLERHLLFYDGQGRVTIDSIIVSDESLYSVNHYDYDEKGNATGELLYGDPQTPGSYYGVRIDTMKISNENLITDIGYSFGADQYSHLFTRSYSSHLNPLYNAEFSKALGCLMIMNDFVFDFRSKYLPAQFDNQEQGRALLSVNYLWTTDATGNVVSGIGKDKNSGIVQQLYGFTY